MLANIISQIIAHKAAIMLGTACVGAVGSVIVATKERDKHVNNIYEEVEDLSDEDMDMEDLKHIDDVEILDVNLVTNLYKKYIPFKRRAIIFMKSYWKTGLLLLATILLMLLSHISMAKELAATAAALGALSTKYKDIQLYLKENYPEQYKEMSKLLSRKNARERISEKGLKKEESYDGRKRYYFPLSDQVVFMKPEDMVKVQGFMSRTIGTEQELYLNDILDYIHHDLGYKDVHISDVDYRWAFPEDSVGDVDFPQIMFEYDDVLDEDKAYVVCQVVTTSYDPEYVRKGA